MTDRKLMQLAQPEQEPVATLLLQAKQNYERNFGPSAAADWIYSDLLDLLDTAPPQRKPQPEQPVQTATYTCGVCGVSMQMEQTEQKPVAQRDELRDRLGSMTDREIMQQALEALKEIVDAADGKGWEQLDPSFKTARAAIKAIEGVKHD